MSERSEHEIRESIDAARARMGETIEQIGDRVNPGRVKAEVKARAREQLHEVKDNMKQKARDTMRNVEHGITDTGRGIWATIRENPVPAGMVGVGLAWLFANRSESGGGYPRDSETYSTGPAVPYRAGVAGADQWNGDSDQESRSIREKASGVMHEATDRIGEAQERLGEAVHDTQERMSGAVQHTQERIGELAHEAKHRAQRAERRIEESLQENPMAIGAVALALGMAAGLLIPETEREHELMGRSRDRVLDRAQDATRRAAEKMHDTAREKAGDTARHVVDEVWPISEDRQTGSLSEARR